MNDMNMNDMTELTAVYQNQNLYGFDLHIRHVEISNGATAVSEEIANGAVKIFSRPYRIAHDVPIPYDDWKKVSWQEWDLQVPGTYGHCILNKGPLRHRRQAFIDPPEIPTSLFERQLELAHANIGLPAEPKTKREVTRDEAGRITSRIRFQTEDLPTPVACATPFLQKETIHHFHFPDPKPSLIARLIRWATGIDRLPHPDSDAYKSIDKEYSK